MLNNGTANWGCLDQLHVGGDTPTRKSFIDAILAVCIPVVFQNDSVRRARSHARPKAPAQPKAERALPAHAAALLARSR